jgi:hypothetical protein
MHTQPAASHLAILALFVFAALPLHAQNPDLVPHASPSCGPANAQFQVTTSNTHTQPQIDPGKALIYLVEEQKFRAFRNVTVRVGLDGQWVGATRGDSYLYFPVDPGEHHLCVDFLSELLEPARQVALYGFTAQPGKTYYFRARTMASVSENGSRNIAILDLDLLNDDQGKLLVANSPQSASHPKK